MARNLSGDLFLAVYTPFILYPYRSDILTFRTYRDFILGDSLQPALNTFRPLDLDRLFRLYMHLLPPTEPAHLYRLSILLSTLHLCVPGAYQESIECLIKTIPLCKF